MARPSTYKSSYVQELIDFSRKNLYFNGSDVDIADLFGVCAITVAKWRHDYPEFAEAVQTVKRRVVSRGENATLKAAIGGYTVVEEQITENPDGSRIIRKTTREVPPNISALKYLLNNRDPEHWSDKREVNHTGETTATVVIQESDAQML